LANGKPVLRTEAVHEFTERIVNPRPPKKETAAPPPASENVKTEPPVQEISRARAIFSAAEEAKPFNPDDFDFAMADEEAAREAPTPSTTESSPAQPLPEVKPTGKRRLGMTGLQLGCVALMAFVLLCILAVFAYLLFFGTASLLP